jgi:hypothetical protein
LESGVNVLIVGNGKGSWTMRGQQLGAAIGARVTTSPTNEDWRWAEVIVLVKKHAAKFAAQAQRVGKPIVWDALDFWSQPAENRSEQDRALALLQAQIRLMKPTLVIGATQAMASACGGVYLPHHSWAGLAPTPARPEVQVVAYEGNPTYLGAWHNSLLDACAERGWRFVLNPPSLSDADIVVALREGAWDGWICREWKSGVKVVNAMAAGRPIVTQMTAAFRELQPVGSAIESPSGLAVALNRCAHVDVRAQAADQPLARSLTLDQVAARYRLMLESVEARCAA